MNRTLLLRSLGAWLALIAIAWANPASGQCPAPPSIDPLTVMMDDVIDADLNGCQATYPITLPTATDCNGMPLPVTVNYPSNNFLVGENIIVFTAIDANGTTSASFTLIVNDNQPPVAVCAAANSVEITVSGTTPVRLDSSLIGGGSMDNCATELIVDPVMFGCGDIGTQTVRLIVQDYGIYNGSVFVPNADTCFTTIVVKDGAAPVASCITLDSIDLDASGMAVLDSLFLDNGSTDDCGPLTYELSSDGSSYVKFDTLSCADVGTSTFYLRVTDKSGNSSTCTGSVKIKDVTAPTVVSSPSNTTAFCSSIPDPGMVVFADSCGIMNVDRDSTITMGSCTGEYTLTRIWTATDNNGNTATISQVIMVTDVDGPDFSLADTLMANSDASLLCGGLVDLALNAANVSDSCAAFGDLTLEMRIDFAASPNYTDIPSFVAYDSTRLDSFPLGTSVVNFRATDDCGNPNVSTVVVVVKDAAAPMFSGPIAARCGTTVSLINIADQCSNTFTWMRPDNSDILDCQGTLTVTETISDPAVAGAVVSSYGAYNYTMPSVSVTNAFPVGSTTITYLADDGQGNTASCSFVVEVEDTQVPIISCPSPQVVESTCTSQTVPSYLGDVGILDNCAASAVVTQTPSTSVTLGQLFTTPQQGDMFTVKMLVEDLGGNKDSCEFTVTLNDGDAPVPSVNTLPAIVSRCGSVIIVPPTATDACNPSSTLITGTTTIPFNDTLNTTPVSYVLNHNPQYNNFALTWTYDDGFGNVSTQTQTITVLPDTFPPNAVCRDLTIPLQADGDTLIMGVMVNGGSLDPDACGPLSYSLSQSMFTCADTGANMVILTVTDAGGNTDTCSATITILDVTAPEFDQAIPADTLIEACADIPAAPVITAMDACQGTFVVDFVETSTRDTAGYGFYNYEITRTWSVSDSIPNVRTAIQTITVRDTQAPVFDNAPTSLVLYTSANAVACSDTFTVDFSSYIQDCSPFDSLILSPAGAVFKANLSLGLYPLIFTAQDETGNFSFAQVSLEVRDGTPPLAICKNGISVNLSPNGMITVPSHFIDNGSEDNCSQSNVMLSPANYTFTCADVANSPVVVSLTVTDPSGNSSTCTSEVTVQDNVGPRITCPSDREVQCDESTSVAAMGSPTATDNCSSTILISNDDETVAGTGVYCQNLLRTWTATDQLGNTATCLQTIGIQDTVAPDLIGVSNQVDTLRCDMALPAIPTVTATDNCASGLMIDFVQDTIRRAPGACGNVQFTVRRTWTVEDDCGNAKSNRHLYAIIDTLAPAFVGLADTLEFFTGTMPGDTSCMVDVSLNVYAMLNECADSSDLVVSNNSAYGDGAFDLSGTYPTGTYTVAFALEDACGNASVDTLTIVVKDITSPQPDCRDFVIVALDSDGRGNLNVDQVDLNTTDNCGIDTMYLTQTDFDCSDLGITPIQMIVEDLSGNTNFCNVSIDVQAGAAPVLAATVNSDTTSFFGAADGELSVTISGGSGNYTFAWSTGDNTATVSSLSGGTYTVTVSDNTTGCEVELSTAVVEGDAVTLYAGDVSAPVGGTAKIPVTAQDFTDFVELVGTLTVGPLDQTVATVTGVSDIHPAFNNAVTGLPIAGNAFILWNGNFQPAVTLAPTDVLFNIDVNILGNIGDTTSIIFQPGIRFKRSNQDTVPASTVNGLLTVIASSGVQIAGVVNLWDNPELAGNQSVPVPNATVFLNGAAADTTELPMGSYSLDVPYDSDNVVKLEKYTAGNAGVRASDLLRIVNFQFGDDFSSPYQWIAADVNRSGNVTVQDITMIQRLVLGTVDHIDNTPDWVFVPANYVFPSTGNPIATGFPDSIEHTNLIQNQLMEDFVAVRRGDVNGDVPDTAFLKKLDDRSVFIFQTEEQSAKAGDRIQVPFRASDFNERTGYQMTLDFDPLILSLASTEANALYVDESNFGTRHLDKGQLTTLWFDAKPKSLQDGDAAFTLTFDVLADMPKLSDVLTTNSTITEALGYDRNGDAMRLGLDYVFPTGGGNTAFELLQNQPNPFNDLTVVQFLLPETGDATLRVTDAAGRVVFTQQGQFAKGINAVQVQAATLGQAGVYFYELETATQTARKKMVVIE